VRAQSAREQARRDLIRFRSLEAAGAVARADLEDAGTKLETTSAQVDVAAQEAQRARAALQQVEASAMDVEVREEEARAFAEQVEVARGQVALANAGLLEVKRQEQQRQTVEQQLEVARGGLAAARAQLQAAVAARDELQAMESETKVYAPLSGVVLHKIVNTGEVVAPGAPLVSLVDLRALWLKVFVPEPQIGKIRLGMPAKVYVDAFPGRPIAARVSEISERAEFTPKDVQTREERVKLVFAVKLAVDNPDGILKPGMPADASILWKTEPAL
jgi:HlyD family secretion protein